MFSSTIIPTVGRDSLARAVNSVLEQDCGRAQWEVIVVNDSGEPLPSAPWQADPRVRILHTNRRERSVARNAGAAVARGRYLHFLDDDDWVLPGAWQALRKLTRAWSEAVWLYGGVQFVDSRQEVLGRFNLVKNGNCLVETMAGVWIPLQASLISCDAFFKVGGFDPGLVVAEDLDLSRRLALIGDFAATEETVAAVLRGVNWGSLSRNSQMLECNRLSRDRLLDQSGALTHMLAGAGDSSYYRGRVLHAYLAAARRNLVSGRQFRAASRLMYGLLALLRSAKHVRRQAYWHALGEHTIMHRLVSSSSPDYDSVSEWLR